MATEGSADSGNAKLWLEVDKDLLHFFYWMQLAVQSWMRWQKKRKE